MLDFTRGSLYFPLTYALAVLAVTSLAGVLLLRLDRKRAREDERRIPELWMILLGAIGGATAMLIYMATTKHKIRYLKFRFGYPIMMAVHLAALIIVALYGPTYKVMWDVDIVYVIAAYAFMTLLGIFITNLDKRHARRGMVRVPEHWLMFIALLGGAMGMYFAMLLIHHKTRYMKFMLGLPLIFIGQVALFAWVYINCSFITIWTP